MRECLREKSQEIALFAQPRSVTHKSHKSTSHLHLATFPACCSPVSFKSHSITHKIHLYPAALLGGRVYFTFVHPLSGGVRPHPYPPTPPFTLQPISMLGRWYRAGMGWKKCSGRHLQGSISHCALSYPSQQGFQHKMASVIY